MRARDEHAPMSSGNEEMTIEGLPRDFTADLGHRHRFDDDGSIVDIPITPTLLTSDGKGIRVSVLAAFADLTTGSIASAALAPRIPLTVSLRIHRASMIAPDSLVARGRVVSLGRTHAVLEAEFRATESTELVASSVVSFMASPRPGDVFRTPIREFSARGSISAPFADQLGAVVLAPGMVELERRPYVMQGSGTVQGGALALVAELAAESAASRSVLDLDLSYLSAVRHGPVRSSVRVLDQSTIRVELVDAGDSNRLAVLAIARSDTRPFEHGKAIDAPP
jgi:acyl-coenzyme A thioesterase PaaI-like protein